jgi:hypothetical protein
MQIIVTNVPSLLTDFGEYIRLDRIDKCYVDYQLGGKARVRGIVGGAFENFSDITTNLLAENGLKMILDAQAKYTMVIVLVTRYDYTGVNMTYKGTHTVINAATSDPNWAIRKFTYTANQLVMEQGPLVGSWDNRASLSW